MALYIAVACLACELRPAMAHAAPAGVAPGTVAVEKLVPPKSSLETILTSDTIFEGPTWVTDGAAGYLLFSDIPGNSIKRLRADGKVSVFAGNIFKGRNPGDAYQSTGSHKFAMLGPGGTTLDRLGRVVYCSFSDGEIVRIEPDGNRTVLASQFAGRHLNAPNDLAYASDGTLYFTDSRAGTLRSDSEGIPHKGLYRLKSGRVELLSRDIDYPNGIAVSPRSKYLYVTNTARKTILRFDMTPGGIAHEKVFADMSSATGIGGPDGIKVDRRGNVYSTGPGGVWVLSPRGQHIRTIETPTQATNLAFGGPDLRTLYVTALGAVYRIRLSALPDAAGKAGKLAAEASGN